MLFVRAKHPRAWIVIGAALGTAIGTALGNSPLGLAAGAVLGLAIALFAGSPGRRLG